MKKLICDIDDVITDSPYIGWINEFLGTNYTTEDVKTYFIEDELLGYDQGKINAFHDWVVANKKDFYQDNVLRKDCFYTLEKLDKKFDLILVSACTSTSWHFQDKEKQKLREMQWAHEFEDKFNFIRKWLPFVSPQNIIYTNRKDLISADIRIDDRLKHLKGSGKIKLLMDSWHNKDIEKTELQNMKAERVLDWNEIGDRLL